MGFDIQSELDRIQAKAEKKREAAWAKNKDNPPRDPEWKREWDEMYGGLTAEMPFCPNCHEPLYEFERCYFCGQAIQQDKKLEDWAEPPKVETMDCFICEGKGTVRYTRSKFNGHKSGECTACGMRFIE